MPALAFTKYEGLGNDFLVVDVGDEARVDADLAARLCDRRRGVGADGVLLVLPARAPGTGARMKVMNADGSVPEMCGNGIRCVAVHLATARGLRGGEIAIETDAGVHTCIVERDANEFMVTVDMGEVRVVGERSLEMDGRSVSLVLADAGNPHAITFAPFSRAEFDRLGPRIATHPSFEGGTNAGFASVAEGGIDLLVWERGVGPTLACGTGACAAVAAAREKGLVSRDAAIRVRLPGGTLVLSLDRATRHTKMRGPARRVFDGTFAIAPSSPNAS